MDFIHTHIYMCMNKTHGDDIKMCYLQTMKRAHAYTGAALESLPAVHESPLSATGLCRDGGLIGSFEKAAGSSTPQRLHDA